MHFFFLYKWDSTEWHPNISTVSKYISRQSTSFTLHAKYTLITPYVLNQKKGHSVLFDWNYFLSINMTRPSQVLVTNFSLLLVSMPKPWPAYSTFKTPHWFPSSYTVYLSHPGFKTYSFLLPSQSFIVLPVSTCLNSFSHTPHTACTDPSGAGLLTIPRFRLCSVVVLSLRDTSSNQDENSLFSYSYLGSHLQHINTPRF